MGFRKFGSGGDRGGDRGGPRNFGGPREMHKATCGDCGAECEVPFKPAEGRPVYCRDCYQNHKKF
ncbi:DNA-directed RNA polymerase [Candidatus Woesearchaeota archaeon]|nr:DNA-directed RNA polymerase [Candidatus Woesearchaeota archaeon]